MMMQVHRTTKFRAAFLAGVLAAGATFAVHADDTADFAAIAMGDLAAGVPGYVNAASVTDPVSGVTATGYASGVRGSGYTSNNLSLYRRNQLNDHGIGVCTDAEGGSTGCGPSDANGDVNELSNQVLWEIIVLQRPANKEWVSVRVSSLDDNTNTGGGPDESGVLWAADSIAGPWVKVADLNGDDANREPTIPIPNEFKNSPYLVFEPVDVVDPANRNNDFLVWQATVRQVMQCTGTGTPGYWKNHPEAWPASVVVGGVQYTAQQAIDVMLETLKGDKTWTMFNAAVSASLNVANGCDCSIAAGDISDVVADAMDWLVSYPLGSGVKGNSYAWMVGEPLYTTLDAYNNGLLCAPHRD